MRLSRFNVAKKPRRLVHDLSVGEVKPITGSVTFEETKNDWTPASIRISLPDRESESRASFYGYYPRVISSNDASEAQQLIAVMREIIAIVDATQETK